MDNLDPPQFQPKRSGQVSANISSSSLAKRGGGAWGGLCESGQRAYQASRLWALGLSTSESFDL